MKNERFERYIYTGVTAMMGLHAAAGVEILVLAWSAVFVGRV